MRNLPKILFHWIRRVAQTQVIKKQVSTGSSQHHIRFHWRSVHIEWRSLLDRKRIEIYTARQTQYHQPNHVIYAFRNSTPPQCKGACLLTLRHVEATGRSAREVPGRVAEIWDTILRPMRAHRHQCSRTSSFCSTRHTKKQFQDEHGGGSGAGCGIRRSGDSSDRSSSRPGPRSSLSSSLPAGKCQ